MFNHFLITRFNIRYQEAHFQLDKSGAPTRTEVWLRKRLLLFEQYCFPSIAHQTNKNFTWLILFDQDTPSFCREIFAQYRQAFPLLMEVLVYPNENYVERTKEAIYKHCSKEARYILTTRLDSDDALHETTIQRIQDAFQEKDDFFINLRYGLQYDAERQILTHIRFDQNPFITRVEKKSNDVRTVLEVMHQYADRTAPITNLHSTPGWLQLIHEGNISNQLWAGSVAHKKADEFIAEFNLGSGIKISRRSVFWHKVASPLFKFRGLLRHLYRLLQ